MGLDRIWTEGVVGSLVVALEWLHGVFVSAGLSAPWLSGWALSIIVFTVAVKLLMLPLTLKQLRSSKAMQDLQPKLQQLQKQHGKDREKLSQEQMKLYKEHGVNPLAGCLPMVVQMPIWFGLYQALYHLATSEQFLSDSGFLWIATLGTPEPYNLGWPPVIPVLALLTGATQWVVQKMMTQPTDDPQQKTMQGMMQFMPLMFIFFAFSVPSGLVLYWVTSNIFSMVQQYFITGWGALAPNRAASPPGAGVSAAKLQPSTQLSIAQPEANGHSSNADAAKRAVAQVPPPTGRKRRRRKG